MKIWLIFISFVFLSACVQPDASIPVSAPESYTDSGQTDFLIYEGPGAWAAELRSLKTILYSNGSTYRTLSPQEMNRLSSDDFKNYRAILFAGGDARKVRRHLNKETRIKIRHAVQKDGLNYLGFCAGAWLAVAPEPESDDEDVIYGLGVVAGPLLDRTKLEKRGAHHVLDESIFPDGTRRKLLWYGGPVTPEVEDGVIAKYSDGTPAITQLKSGRGTVIISGLHPAATKPILNDLGFEEKEAIAPELTWKLLEATINGTSLPTF